MMQLQKIDCDFTTCKVKSAAQIDFSREFVFLSKTDDEISLVCDSRYLPDNAIAPEAGWKALRVSGVLDFGMIGVISKIATILAEAKIGIFVVSTYNTDYIFVKSADLDNAAGALTRNGYIVG